MSLTIVKHASAACISIMIHDAWNACGELLETVLSIYPQLLPRMGCTVAQKKPLSLHGVIITSTPVV